MKMIGTIEMLIKKHKKNMKAIKAALAKRGWTISNKALAKRIKNEK
jgi:hypothetical protein